MREAIELWQELGAIPIDKNGGITETFQKFPIGTDRKKIYNWFEEIFDVEVYDLMYGKNIRTKEKK
jgi:hypothetical protein